MTENLSKLHQQLTREVIGSEEPALFLLVSLLANGHALIQGPPGIGKTSLAQALADGIDGSFSRIQFTPDLLPSDIVGYSLYRRDQERFEFIEGPVFSNILLADEINRTSPRIQSALLECMNEQQVSVDGVTRPLQSPFLVVATQNNLYATGTFPLPEPQLDRFLLSIEMALPKPEAQADILKLHANPSKRAAPQKWLNLDEVGQLQQQVAAIPVNDRVAQYMVNLCEAARRHKGLWNGLSARASIALMRAAQAMAFLNQNPAVYPDDVKRVFPAVLAHRLASSDYQDLSEGGIQASMGDLLRNTPVP